MNSKKKKITFRQYHSDIVVDCYSVHVNGRGSLVWGFHWSKVANLAIVYKCRSYNQSFDTVAAARNYIRQQITAVEGIR